MKHISILNLNTSLKNPLIVHYCENFFCRLRGLMFRTHLNPDEGLLLIQSHDSRINASIHMLFVFMDLAVIWIKEDYIVVDSILARAWRPVYFPQRAAKYILEFHPERLHEFDIGDKVAFQ